MMSHSVKPSWLGMKVYITRETFKFNNATGVPENCEDEKVYGLYLSKTLSP